jgi:hypothetical protein
MPNQKDIIVGISKVDLLRIINLLAGNKIGSEFPALISGFRIHMNISIDLLKT